MSLEDDIMWAWSVVGRWKYISVLMFEKKCVYEDKCVSYNLILDALFQKENDKKKVKYGRLTSLVSSKKKNKQKDSTDRS